MERGYSSTRINILATRSLAWLAWALCALSLALASLSFTLALISQQPLWQETYVAGVAASALVGSLVAARRPANPVGWIFLGSACSYAAFALSRAYTTLSLVMGSSQSPLAAATTWGTSFLIFPGLGLLLFILPLFYPTGTLPGPAWRLAAWANALLISLAALFHAFRPGPLNQLPAVINPFGFEAFGEFVPILNAVVSSSLFAGMLGTIASAIVRFRRSRGVERQQMKWLTFAVVAWMALVLIAMLLDARQPEESVIPALEVLIGLAFAGIPVAAGVAVLRYRLYAIDRIIDHTLLYGVLTAAVLGLYAVLVGYIGALFGTGRTFFVSAVATGVVAVVFQPLRFYLQRGVNRLLYGRRDDPHAVISSLGKRLEGVVAADTVLPTIVETLARELKLPYAAIVLDDTNETAAAAVGSPTAPVLALPLVDAGAVIGHLIVAARAPDKPFTPGEQHLLEDLARHAGTAVRAARLTHQLQRSRERLVTAREEERRRLQRDLHDGLGPTLASLTMQLDTALALRSNDPTGSQALLVEMQGQLREAVGTVRRIVHQLRPPLLDQLGLLAAVREHALRSERGFALRIQLELPAHLPHTGAAVEVVAYYILIEALHNAARHARARSCWVRLEVAQGLQIAVEDDGIGLPKQYTPGVGLHSMQTRAAEIGGWCLVVAAPRGGTVVRAWLPLPHEQQQQEEYGADSRADRG